MALVTYPTGQKTATVARWGRMARLFNISAIVGPATLNSFGLTFVGRTITIGRGTDGVAEAWVKAYFLSHEETDRVIEVPANTNATLSRVDRVVLRWTPTTEEITIELLVGTPAASPVAPAVTQNAAPAGIYELPLWRFVVPPASGSPISGLVDERLWKTPDTGYVGIVGSASQSIVATATWTGATPATANSALRGVCWSPARQLFVAVGDSGGVQTSPDGLTWTGRNLPAPSNSYPWSAVCWSPGLGLFVAVSPNNVAAGIVVTSPDGITWTSRTLPSAPAGGLAAVCWSPALALFVAVGSNSTTASGRAWTSPDGITWTARTITSNSQLWTGVCWSPEVARFVAVASNTGANDTVATSPDGITWTTRVMPAGGWRAVCWSPELARFIAVANVNGYGYVAASLDGGITWSNRFPSLSPLLTGVCWSPEFRLFVAVGDVNTAQTNASTVCVWTSPDGITWTGRPVGSPSGWAGVCWSPERGMFVAVAAATAAGYHQIMTSMPPGT